MLKIKAIQEKIKEHTAHIAELEQQLKNEYKKTLVRCRQCKLGWEIGELVYIQEHYYVPPSGCMDGDYWRPEKGGIWNCSCGTRNLVPHEVVSLKDCFLKTKDVYDRK